MSNLVRFYKARCEEARELAISEDYDAALDICWELRLKSDLGIYRRARVNLLIASVLPNERYDEILMFANEALDLFDLLRQQNDPDGVQLAEQKHVQGLEEIAKNVIADAKAEHAENNPLPSNAENTSTQLLSEADHSEVPPTPSKTIISGMENLKLDLIKETMEQGMTHGKIVWDPGFIRNPAIDHCPANLPQIEGYLRDGYYKPFPRDPSPPQERNVVPRVYSTKPRLPMRADSSATYFTES